MPVNDDPAAEKGAVQETNPGNEPPKNIVICSDGTGNAGGQGYPTNVWAIYNAIDINGHETDPGIPRQIAFHDDGVGTESWKPLKVAGGAFGLGLSRNIRQLYSMVAKNFNDGDRIYLFGFSRGAFTVRSLAGLIASQGILDIRSPNIQGPKEFKEAVKWTYRQYRAAHRKKTYRRFPDEKTLKGKIVAFFDLPKYLWLAWDGMRDALGKDHHKNHKYHRPKKGEKHIACIGVWDTVDAVGVPMDWMREVLDYFFRNNFHQAGLNPDIGRGYHALAIDDERKTFHPVMWKEDEKDTGRVKQVWFAGVHSNVGGGYPKQGLAQVSLHWMMNEIERDRVGRYGLHFKDGALKEVAADANPHDMLYDSRKGPAGLYRYGPRNIGKISHDYCSDRVPLIHDSVFERIWRHTHAYAPGNIPRDVTVATTVDPRAAPEVKAAALPAGTYEEFLAKHYQKYESRLKGAAKLITVRRIVYILFLTSLLAIAVFAAKSYEGNFITCFDSIRDCGENALRTFYDKEPAVLISFLTFLALLFLLRTILRSWAQKLFGRYWW